MSPNNHHNRTIQKNLLSAELCKKPPSINDEVVFGKVHSNHMFICDYLHQLGGWQTPQIVPFAPFMLEPDSVVFHYGQQIFEGLKAYRMANDDNEIALFRPELNAQRFYYSAERLGMQPVPVEMFLEGIKALVDVDREFVLPQPGSLYIRPCLIPLDRGVSYHASHDYRFFIILSSAKSYFAAERTVDVYVEQEMVRAVRGGCGDTKAGANYATSVKALNYAKSIGADSVLWLDALERRYVEEMGAMNVAFIYKDRLVTPPLSGTILPGVTRDSVIKLARHLGMPAQEELCDIHEIIKAAKDGSLLEAFACGTAAIVTPIGRLIFNNEHIDIGKRQAGPFTMKLRLALQGIQTGQAADPFGWRVPVPKLVE
jgi:branched-chain amino acid aminotransferase